MWSSATAAGDHFIILHVIPTGQAASEFFAPNSPQNHASILVRVTPLDGLKPGPAPSPNVGNTSHGCCCYAQYLAMPCA